MHCRNATWVDEHHIAHPTGMDPGGNSAYTTPMHPGHEMILIRCTL